MNESQNLLSEGNGEKIENFVQAQNVEGFLSNENLIKYFTVLAAFLSILMCICVCWLRRNQPEEEQVRQIGEECTICLGTFIPYKKNENNVQYLGAADQKPVKILPCGHAFCQVCWDTWLRGNSVNAHLCTVCRMDSGERHIRNPTQQQPERGRFRRSLIRTLVDTHIRQLASSLSSLITEEENFPEHSPLLTIPVSLSSDEGENLFSLDTSSEEENFFLPDRPSPIHSTDRSSRRSRENRRSNGYSEYGSIANRPQSATTPRRNFSGRRSTPRQLLQETAARRPVSRHRSRRSRASNSHASAFNHHPYQTSGRFNRASPAIRPRHDNSNRTWSRTVSPTDLRLGRSPSISNTSSFDSTGSTRTRPIAMRPGLSRPTSNSESHRTVSPTDLRLGRSPSISNTSSFDSTSSTRTRPIDIPPGPRYPPR